MDSFDLKKDLCLDKYQLETLLGKGAMSEVWLGKDTSGQHYALKFPKRHHYLRYLRQEENLLAGIEHPRICRVLESHLDEEIPFLVMEYVKGKPLRAFCHGRITSEEATIIADQILEGLMIIHDHGYLHLDLKPENILVTPDGEIKIVDFGLGRAACQVMADLYLSASLVSRELPLAGTLAYMSPEQRKGHPLDARSDLYSCGVIIHELLTGQLPAPSKRVLHFRKDLPPRWDVIIAEFTHPLKEKRPSDAREARQRVAFSLVEKIAQPVQGNPHELRDLLSIDLEAFEQMSPYAKGDQIGDCTLIEILGRGGYGEVWKAMYEKKGTQKRREVAVKIALKMDDSSLLLKEGMLMKKIPHPSVPKVLKIKADHNPPFMILELVEGKSLRLILTENEKIPLSQALPIMSYMAKVVSACHQEKVVHGDLKPEHFLITAKEPFLYLLDFGLGDMAREEPFFHTLGTKFHGIAKGGTYDYMAPEQKEGSLTPQTDIYALGVCFFEMLTGVLPKGPQPMRMIDKSIPRDLDELILSMIHPDPKFRPNLKKIIQAIPKIQDHSKRIYIHEHPQLSLWKILSLYIDQVIFNPFDNIKATILFILGFFFLTFLIFGIAFYIIVYM